MAKSHAPDVLGAGTSPRPVARSLIGPLYRSACPIRSGVGAWWALAQKSACHPNASPKMNLQTCKGNQHPTDFTDPGSITQSTFSIKKQTNKHHHLSFLEPRFRYISLSSLQPTCKECQYYYWGGGADRWGLRWREWLV